VTAVVHWADYAADFSVSQFEHRAFAEAYIAAEDAGWTVNFDDAVYRS
jgi:hypothetical protein